MESKESDFIKIMTTILDKINFLRSVYADVHHTKQRRIVARGFKTGIDDEERNHHRLLEQNEAKQSNRASGYRLCAPFC